MANQKKSKRQIRKISELSRLQQMALLSIQEDSHMTRVFCAISPKKFFQQNLNPQH